MFRLRPPAFSIFLAAGLAGSLALQSCGGVTTPNANWSRGLGLVQDGTPPFTSLIAPDVVHRGEAFQITASTFGSSSCTRPDGYELSVTALGAEIKLYDWGAPVGAVCTADLGTFPRTITLQFEQPGSATITVIGRGYDRQLEQVQRVVVVE